MTVSKTMILKNTAETIEATMRYISNPTAYPKDVPSYTEQVLADGTHAFDVSAYPHKRRWDLIIQAEDTGDDLLSKLNSLKYTECLFTEDALVVEEDIPVFFRDFEANYQVGIYYTYRVGLQEL